MRSVNTPRAAIYARISTHDPNVDKPADQVKNCRALAERAGYEVVRIYMDDGISAYSGKTRHSFVDLYDDIAANEFEVIVATAEDRLARSSEEKIGFQVHCAKHSVVWHTIAGGKVDPATAQGALLSTITGAIAQYESHVKSERIKASVQRRLADGYEVRGRRPFGFEVDRRTIRESEAEVLRGAYRTLMEVGTIYAVTAYLNRSGAKTTTGGEWRTNSVRHLLDRPRNAGIVVTKGVEYGRFEPSIITEDEFLAAKAIIDSGTDRVHKPKSGGPRPKALMAHLLICGKCGQRMVSGGAYYRCLPPNHGLRSPGLNDGSERSRRVKGTTHAGIERNMLDRAVKERVFLRMVEAEAGGGVFGELEDSGDSGILGIRIQLAEIYRQRDVAQQIALMPGANLAMAAKQMAQFADQIEELENEIQGLLVSSGKASVRALAREALKELAPGVLAFDGAAGFEAWLPGFEELPIEKRQEIVKIFVPRVVVKTTGERKLKRVDFGDKEWVEGVSVAPF